MLWVNAAGMSTYVPSTSRTALADSRGSRPERRHGRRHLASELFAGPRLCSSGARPAESMDARRRIGLDRPAGREILQSLNEERSPGRLAS